MTNRKHERITATVQLKGRTVVNGVKAIKVTVTSIGGQSVHPTKLLLTGTARKRGNKLYAPNGVYTIVGS